MSKPTPTLPRLRQDVVVQRMSDREFVVRLTADRKYFSIGAEEAFLLQRLDGTLNTIEALIAEFEKEFDDQLSQQDVNEFVELANSRMLLETPTEESRSQARQRVGASRDNTPISDEIGYKLDDEDDEEDFQSTGKQSPLFYRVPLIDPDQMFNRLEPKLRWIWTKSFLAISSLAMLFALLILWNNQSDVAASFSDALRWETVLLAWLIVTAATIFHEAAHGLTCKHFGGEVHEIGALLIFFMPCLYCDVSDAWMIPEKRKRLLITAAGGYCDLCQWALAVFVWRITVPDSLINYLAFVVLTVCGTRGFINFNPLLRLDGYYLLSDSLGIPNLRKRSQEYFMGHLRWLLWGAKRPERESRGGLLLAYGLMAWTFALGFLNYISLKMLKFVSDEFGMLGIAFTSLLMLYAVQRVFKGFFKGEVLTMIKTRHIRVLCWLCGGVTAITAAFLIPVKHYATGDFEVRAGDRHEVHVPVTGFISEILVSDGSRVAVGDAVARLKSPDLEAQISTKEAELRGVEANLAKLRMGTRPEQIAAAKDKVARLRNWVELGQREIDRAREAYQQELQALDQRIGRTRTQWEFAKQNYAASERLYEQKALAGAQLKSEQVQLTLLNTQIAEAEADRRAKEAIGIRIAEIELTRREQDLADAVSQLDLFEAGTRPEEIAAEEAKQEQFTEQLRYLSVQRDKLVVRASVAGVVATPRMQEKIGQLTNQGAILCVIENSDTSRVEIAVSEDDLLGIRSGQPVLLKARALPFETFEATVEHIATATTGNSSQSAKQRNVLIVHCLLSNTSGQLRSGMTGFGRVFRGDRTLGTVMLGKALRYLRTEFWW